MSNVSTVMRQGLNADADLILVLGSRLDMRQIGKNKESFALNARIIHIDIDKSELKHKIETFEICDAKTVIAILMSEKYMYRED